MHTCVNHHDDDLDETEVLVFGSACSLTHCQGFNAASAARYIKLYDAASTGDVTPGTTLPKFVLGISATGDNAPPFQPPAPIAFSNGIVAIGATAAADTGAQGSPGANEIIADIGFVPA